MSEFLLLFRITAEARQQNPGDYPAAEGLPRSEDDAF